MDTREPVSKAKEARASNKMRNFRRRREQPSTSRPRLRNTLPFPLVDALLAISPRAVLRGRGTTALVVGVRPPAREAALISVEEILLFRGQYPEHGEQNHR